MSLFASHPMPWTRSGTYLNRVVDANDLPVAAPTDKLAPLAESVQICNLIAAAPELMFALVRMLHKHDHMTRTSGGKPGESDCWHSVAVAARAALVKAGYLEPTQS